MDNQPRRPSLGAVRYPYDASSGYGRQGGYAAAGHSHTHEGANNGTLPAPAPYPYHHSSSAYPPTHPYPSHTYPQTQPHYSGHGPYSYAAYPPASHAPFPPLAVHSAHHQSPPINQHQSSYAPPQPAFPPLPPPHSSYSYGSYSNHGDYPSQGYSETYQTNSNVYAHPSPPFHASHHAHHAYNSQYHSSSIPAEIDRRVREGGYSHASAPPFADPSPAPSAPTHPAFDEELELRKIPKANLSLPLLPTDSGVSADKPPFSKTDASSHAIASRIETKDIPIIDLTQSEDVTDVPPVSPAAGPTDSLRSNKEKVATQKHRPRTSPPSRSTEPRVKRQAINKKSASANVSIVDTVETPPAEMSQVVQAAKNLLESSTGDHPRIDNTEPPLVEPDSPLSLEPPKRRTVPQHVQDKDLPPTQPHPDTSAILEIQKSFMSNLYLSDNPDFALHPFRMHANRNESRTNLAELLNTPLLRTGEMPIHLAAKWGKLEAMLELIRCGANPRLRSGWTCPRHPCASVGGDMLSEMEALRPCATPPLEPEKMRTRKRKSADSSPRQAAPEATLPSPASTDPVMLLQWSCTGCIRIDASTVCSPVTHEGWTALHIVVSRIAQRPGDFVCWEKLRNVARAMKSSRFDRCPTTGETAVHIAAKSGEPKLVNSLLEAWKDETNTPSVLECGDVMGRTPVHVLCESSMPAMLSSPLLDEIRDKCAWVWGGTDSRGRTPLEACIERWWDHAVSLGLNSDEVEALTWGSGEMGDGGIKYIHDKEEFQRSLAEVLLLFDLIAVRNGTPSKTADRIRRMCIVEGHDGWSIHGMVGARVLAVKIAKAMCHVSKREVGDVLARHIDGMVNDEMRKRLRTLTVGPRDE